MLALEQGFSTLYRAECHAERPGFIGNGGEERHRRNEMPSMREKMETLWEKQQSKLAGSLSHILHLKLVLKMNTAA